MTTIIKDQTLAAAAPPKTEEIYNTIDFLPKSSEYYVQKDQTLLTASKSLSL